ncbi:uncharacterized protein BJX67DRAFT_144724 [Aspergillus lucknowensis]|uniref:Uncharacterized protein n=1 Tax=Aspergillus lucknowensis TaxID=176173 RepID=A0ABR4LP41_9EURO
MALVGNRVCGAAMRVNVIFMMIKCMKWTSRGLGDVSGGGRHEAVWEERNKWSCCAPIPHPDTDAHHTLLAAQGDHYYKTWNYYSGIISHLDVLISMRMFPHLLLFINTEDPTFSFPAHSVSVCLLSFPQSFSIIAVLHFPQSSLLIPFEESDLDR